MYEKWNELNITQLDISYTKIVLNGPSMSTKVGQKNVANEVSEFEGSLLAKSPGPIPALGVLEFSLSMGQRRR